MIRLYPDEIGALHLKFSLAAKKKGRARPTMMACQMRMESDKKKDGFRQVRV